MGRPQAPIPSAASHHGAALPVLGQLASDPIGHLLGTGFARFTAPCGVDGLARADADGSHLEVLAVVARQPGTGQLRRFVRDCQAAYHTLTFLEVWSPLLESALARYGFRRLDDGASWTWKAPLDSLPRP